jgi:hypothetical protein
MDENENKYDEVQTPEPADQPENPLGEATDPAAAVGQAVTENTPDDPGTRTESTDPAAEHAAEPVDGGVAIAAPLEGDDSGE